MDRRRALGRRLLTIVRARRSRRGEEGVAIILIALLMVALLVFAAFAIDLGLGFNERRQDQSASDTAATSSFVNYYISGEIDDLVDEAIRVSRESLDNPPDLAAWTEEWENCTDPDRPAEYTPVQTSDGFTWECLSMTDDFAQYRVHLPDIETETNFAKAFGIDSITTSAFTEIRVGGPYIPPFVALANTQAGTQICLRTSSSQDPPALLTGNGPGNPPSVTANADPCDSVAYPANTSTFGTLRPYEYDNGCIDGPGNQTIYRALAVGIDHPAGAFGNFDLGIPQYDPAMSEAERDLLYDDVRIDGNSSCNTPFPNTFVLDTGFTTATLRCGLLSLKDSDFCEGEVPRLRQGPYTQNTYTFASEAMDNLPLWDFFVSTTEVPVLSPVPCESLRSNKDNSTWDHYDKMDTLLECLADWQPEDGQLFDPVLAESARFTFVPKIAEESFSGPSSVHINDFVPVFINKLYEQANGRDPCDPIDPRPSVDYQMHMAGQEFSCGGVNSSVHRMSAIAISCGQLPESMCVPSPFGGPGGSLGPGAAPLEIEITR